MNLFDVPRAIRGLLLTLTWIAIGGGSDRTVPSTSAPDAGSVEDDGGEPNNDGLDDGGATPAGSDGGSLVDGGGGGDGDGGGGGTPIPTKIRYVLILIKENHTFDNYSTGFPGATSSATAKLSTGKTITRADAPAGPLAKDLCHSNACGQTAYRKGGLDGFDLTGAGMLPFVRYTEAQIPNYWEYAKNFVLVDHLFSTTLGPSTPGHGVFWTGQSMVLDNASCTKTGGACSGFGCTAGADEKILAYDPDTCTTKTVAPCFDVPSLPDHLPKGFTWADYGGPLAVRTS